VIAFRDAPESESWLDAHVDLHDGVWLKIAKKGSGISSLTAESQRNATVPPDHAAALATSPGATRAFDALGRTDRYAVNYANPASADARP